MKAAKNKSTSPVVLATNEDDPSSLNPEEQRFVSYLDTYLNSSPGVSLGIMRSNVGNSPTSQPPPTTTPASKANKTITSRQAIYGDKKTSGAGIQSIKTAGKVRTNSKKL